MNFIEQLFGIAPDAGSGSLEFFLLLGPICGLLWATRSYWRTRPPIGR